MYNSKYRKATLIALDEHWAEHFVPPTIRELCEATGCPSSDTMKKLLRALVGEGVILRCGTKYVPRWVESCVSLAADDLKIRLGNRQVNDEAEEGERWGW